MSLPLNPIGKMEFLSILRSLWNIDRADLPELSDDEWPAFRDHPHNFFKQADRIQSDAIWREVEKRQLGGTASMNPVVMALDEQCMWSNPDTFEQAADAITCDGMCEHAWREYDTNAGGCYAEERGEYCPFVVAETLRAVGKCARLAQQRILSPQADALEGK